VQMTHTSSFATKINHVEEWENNLKLNKAKPVEIVLVSPRSKQAMVLAPPAVSDFQRVKTTKALGVAISWSSPTHHIDIVLGACAKTVCSTHSISSWAARRCGLCCLPSYRRCQADLRIISLVGFLSAADLSRIEAFSLLISEP